MYVSYCSAYLLVFIHAYIHPSKHTNIHYITVHRYIHTYTCHYMPESRSSNFQNRWPAVGAALGAKPEPSSQINKRTRKDEGFRVSVLRVQYEHGYSFKAFEMAVLEH